MKSTLILPLLLILPAFGQEENTYNNEAKKQPISKFFEKYLPKTIAGVVTGAAAGAACYGCEKYLSLEFPEKLITWALFSALRQNLAKKINCEIFDGTNKTKDDSMIGLTARLSDWIMYLALLKDNRTSITQ